MATQQILGIDLGTTNSAVGLWIDGRAVLVPDRNGRLLTPSAIGLDDDGALLIGDSALARLFSHPHLTQASFKRFMGSSAQLNLGAQSFRAEELSALLLRQLKQNAERWLGETVVDAVITVPAYFNEIQRRAVKTAGELAGLNVVRLLNEPTAASLAFGLLDNREQKFLTFDLGGGTFDVSIIDMFEGVVEVRASSGDVMLGGDDFTAAIQHWMLEQHPALKEGLPQLEPLLHKRADALKHALSAADSASLHLDWQGQTWHWTLDENALAACCKPLLARLQQPIQQALRDARFSLDELNHIVLVGGATRMPLVHQAVARLFGRFPRYDLNPDEAVALGAAVQAGMVMVDAAVEDIVLTDVMPFTLGVEVAKQNYGQIDEGFFMPVIERNTFLPVSKSDIVNTTYDNQRTVCLKVYQGEGRRVKDNILLGEMRVDVPPRAAGEVALEVRFTYTLDGLLEVECRQLDGGDTVRLVIEKTPGQMSEQQIADSLQRLTALKQHPRDNAENRALLRRGTGLYSRLLGEARGQVDAAITAFEFALESQDARIIHDARQQVEQVLERFGRDVTE